VPLIVITFADQEAVTPEGKPVEVPMPVARVVECVIFVNAVFCIKLGLEDAAPAEQANTLGVNFLVLLLEGGGELPIRFLANTLKIYDTLVFKQRIQRRDEEKKKKVWVEEFIELPYNQIKEAKIVISFK
jgi:hypothetical protein